MNRRSAFRGLFVIALTATLAGCGVLGGARPAVRVGSTNFTEQLILAELYAQVLEQNGYRIEFSEHTIGTKYACLTLPATVSDPVVVHDGHC